MAGSLATSIISRWYSARAVTHGPGSGDDSLERRTKLSDHSETSRDGGGVKSFSPARMPAWRAAVDSGLEVKALTEFLLAFLCAPRKAKGVQVLRSNLSVPVMRLQDPAG